VPSRCQIDSSGVFEAGIQNNEKGQQNNHRSD
jgi:hypothetical protein